MYILPHDPRIPTPASQNDVSSHLQYARQATTTIVSNAPPPANCAGQYSGGALAGAVLGTFFGTLLLVYLFSVIQANKFRRRETEEVIIEKRRRHKSRSGSHSSVRRPSAVYSQR